MISNPCPNHFPGSIARSSTKLFLDLSMGELFPNDSYISEMPTSNSGSNSSFLTCDPFFLQKLKSHVFSKWPIKYQSRHQTKCLSHVFAPKEMFPNPKIYWVFLVQPFAHLFSPSNGVTPTPPCWSGWVATATGDQQVLNPKQRTSADPISWITKWGRRLNLSESEENLNSWMKLGAKTTPMAFGWGTLKFSWWKMRGLQWVSWTSCSLQHVG